MAEIDKTLQWLNASLVIAPALVDLLIHYKNLAELPELNETDRIVMKENLNRLRLPNWDEI